MNQTYRIGDKVVIHKVGHVEKVVYDSVSKRIEYWIRFEDGQTSYGYANVTDDVLMQPGEQRLTQDEINRLFKDGLAS